MSASLALLAGVLLVCPPGCRAPASGDRPAEVPVRGQGVEIVLWSLSDLPADQTGGRGEGIEGSRVRTAQPRDALAAVLRRVGAGTPDVSEAAIAMWRGCGLRVWRVPIDSVTDLEGALQARSGQRRSWIAMGPSPTELLRGPVAPAGTLVMTDADSLPLDASAMAMLLRAWTVPVGAGSAELDAWEEPSTQVEFLLRVARRAGNPRDLSQTLTDSLREQPEGPGGIVSASVEGLLPRLTLGALVARGDALVIESIAGDERPEGDGAGPPVPSLPTLGEALLSDALAFPRSGVRIVVVVMPRGPAAYRLLRDE